MGVRNELLFYLSCYYFTHSLIYLGLLFDRMRFHLNDAKRLGVMEDW